MSKRFTPIFGKWFVLSLFSLVLSIGFLSCGDDTEEVLPAPDFDRAAMLASVADNLIIPNFTALQASVDVLSTATNEFVTNTTEENLTGLRTAWVQAVTDHQYCSAFGFGPADLLLGEYAKVLGAFPVSESKIEGNILVSDYNLANSFDLDVRGFYGVEYLIYGNGQSDSELVAGFDQNRKDYLVLIVDELKTNFDNIVGEWTSTYRQEFVSNDETSSGSPISLYYNGFVKDYENIKNFKVELPAGLTADQETPDGSLVAAFYSGISRDLIIEHFENSKNIYFGLTRDGDEIIGFEEYLEAAIGGPELVAQTKEAVTRIDAAIADLPEGRLSDNIESDKLVTLRDELQDNTANFKSSVVSLLGLTITFNSGDGD
ncbi:MAG: imelysin family protein [Bacteroidota bacterium]